MADQTQHKELKAKVAPKDTDALRQLVRALARHAARAALAGTLPEQRGSNDDQPKPE
jgi:hypothetical protein